jgi:membrane-associated phospholipid phosphatase
MKFSRCSFLSSVIAILFVASAGLLRADAVLEWNAVLLQAIKRNATPPPVASRQLAILHAAIFDAANGIAQQYTPYRVTEKPAGVASQEAAISAAARQVLLALCPAQSTAIENAYATSLGRIPRDRARDAGIAWGNQVAAAILDWRRNDGAAVPRGYVPGTGPGAWQATPPAFAPALLPQWPDVTPFAMSSVADFRPAPPPELASVEYAANVAHVQRLGAANSPDRTAEQTAIALFWADGGGTVTPPGHWNVIAADVAGARGTSTLENARLFAWLNFALADAGIVAWDCKYRYNFWRPITAIRSAETDGNPDTVADGSWTPLLVTPPFPECVSGHSTFSGAAAAVLAAFFGSDEIPFTTTSEDLPGVTRSFPSFSAAASEAGISRIYGGIHFMFSNLAGLDAGNRVGVHVTQTLLAARPGQRQRGHD